MQMPPKTMGKGVGGPMSTEEAKRRQQKEMELRRILRIQQVIESGEWLYFIFFRMIFWLFFFASYPPKMHFFRFLKLPFFLSYNFYTIKLFSLYSFYVVSINGEIDFYRDEEDPLQQVCESIWVFYWLLCLVLLLLLFSLFNFLLNVMNISFKYLILQLLYLLCFHFPFTQISPEFHPSFARVSLKFHSSFARFSAKRMWTIRYFIKKCVN